MSRILELNKKNYDENFQEAVKKALKYQNDYNAFVTILDKSEHEEKKNILNGVPYALKDNYSTKGILTTGSSNLLKDYVPVYSATVYEKLQSAGAVLVGKTVLDEFAMGGTSTTGHTGSVKNPYDKTRMAGGSSGGSAASVALGIVPFALGSDTGDSVRKPASFCGIVGFKPTYGRISRYGLFPFSSSLDHVGVFATSVTDVSIVTDALKGHDDKDLTTLPDDNISYYENLEKNVKGTKLFYISELLEKEKDKESVKLFFELVEKLKKNGIEVVEEHFEKKLLDATYPVYFVISSAEATSNLSNLTGIPFGSRISGKDATDVMIKTRTKGFSEFIKRRFVLGSYALKEENQEKIFLNACRVRRLIVEGMNNLFSKYDGLLMPIFPEVAPKLNDDDNEEKITDKNYALENHLIMANFGGFPSITLPLGFVNEMPTGVNLTCAAKEDLKTLNIAYHIEKITGYEDLTVGGKENV